MLLCDALKDKVMDIRLRDKLLTEGKISAEDVEKYLSKLEEDGSRLSYTDKPSDENLQ